MKLQLGVEEVAMADPYRSVTRHDRITQTTAAES